MRKFKIGDRLKTITKVMLYTHLPIGTILTACGYGAYDYTTRTKTDAGDFVLVSDNEVELATDPNLMTVAEKRLLESTERGPGAS